jgi:hypothetical protein
MNSGAQKKGCDPSDPLAYSLAACSFAKAMVTACCTSASTVETASCTSLADDVASGLLNRTRNSTRSHFDMLS